MPLCRQTVWTWTSGPTSPILSVSRLSGLVFCLVLDTINKIFGHLASCSSLFSTGTYSTSCLFMSSIQPDIEIYCYTDRKLDIRPDRKLDIWLLSDIQLTEYPANPLFTLYLYDANMVVYMRLYTSSSVVRRCSSIMYIADILQYNSLHSSRRWDQLSATFHIFTICQNHMVLILDGKSEYLRK